MRAFSEYAGRLDPPSGVHSETIASVRKKLHEGGPLICEVGGEVAGCVFYAPKAGYLTCADWPSCPNIGAAESAICCCERRNGVLPS